MKRARVTFEGCEALELNTNRARLVATLDRGPRIAFLGRPGGENLLYWSVDDIGRGEWRLLGGHRVWVTRPGADESEEAYAPDNGPCLLEESESEVTITGAEHPFLRTRRGVKIRVLEEDSFEITSFVQNSGPMLHSGGVWALTCVRPGPGMTVGVPLGDRRLDWDVVKIVFARTWAGHTSRVTDPQISLTENFMIVHPQGAETKRMLWAPLGIIGASWPDRGLSFIKRTHSEPHGQYPQGCNLAVYVAEGNLMTELETCGAEQTILPGETAVNVETWRLFDQVFDWSEPDSVIGVAS